MLCAALFVAAAAITIIVLSRGASVPRPDSSPEEIAEARRAARKAVAAALAKPDAFSREGAVLDIRATETRLRDAGFTMAADTFAATAEAELRAAAVID